MKGASLDEDGNFTVTGIYDSLGDIQVVDGVSRAVASDAEPSPIGRVVGMLTNNYQDSISDVFDIYDPQEGVEGIDISKRVYFRFGQDDLKKDAGIMTNKPVKPNNPTPTPPGGGGPGGGPGGGIPTIPQTGGTMAVFILLLVALLAMIGYLLTGKKKEDDDEDGGSSDQQQNAGQG